MKTRWSAQTLRQFKTEPFDNHLLRAVALGHFGGSAIGECLEIAANIRDWDFESWRAAWIWFAEKLERRAGVCAG